MAELTPIPTAQRPSDAGYQPISGYAVAAAIVTGLFPLVLIISRNSAVLAIPLAGVVLSFVARSHIRRSEGTRTGLRIVSACWWISVLGGAGFGAYLFASSMIMERKSSAVVDRLFKEMKEGKVEAFKLMVPVEERYRVPEQGDMTNAEYNAEFEKAFQSFSYGAFKNHELAMLFERNKDTIEWEHKGSKGVASEGTNLQATHFYVVRCAEGIFDVRVSVTLPESKKGEKVEWYIPSVPAPNFAITKAEPSRYGTLTKALQQEGDNEARVWVDHFSTRRWLPVFLMTTSPEHRNAINTAQFGSLMVGGSAAIAIPIGPGLLPADRATRWQLEEKRIAESGATGSYEQCMFNDLTEIGFFRRDEANGRYTDEQQFRLRKIWKNVRLSSMGGQQAPGRTDATHVSIRDNAVTVSVPIEFAFESSGSYVKAFLLLECSDRDVLAQVRSAREAGVALIENPPPTQVALPQGFPARNWRVVGIQSDMEVILPPAAGPPKR